MGRPQTIGEYLEGFSGQGRQLLEQLRVPDDLLRRVIAFRVREHEEDGVLWM